MNQSKNITAKHRVKQAQTQAQAQNRVDSLEAVKTVIQTSGQTRAVPHEGNHQTRAWGRETDREPCPNQSPAKAFRGGWQ